jgi:hypothetical protein
MPRRCSCCLHGERTAIDEALVRRDSFRGIARRYRVSPDAVERHARGHLSAAIVKAQEAKEVANGDALLAQIQDLQKRTLAILTAAEKDDARTALVAVHQARENVALLSKLVSELQPNGGKSPPKRVSAEPMSLEKWSARAIADADTSRAS